MLIQHTIMAKKNKNNALLPSVYSSEVSGVIAGVVIQKNGIIRRKITSHKSVRQKNIDNGK